MCVQGAWEETDGMSLDELVDREMQEKDGRVPKRVAAQTFYEMLVLKSKGTPLIIINGLAVIYKSLTEWRLVYLSCVAV